MANNEEQPSGGKIKRLDDNHHLVLYRNCKGAIDFAVFPNLTNSDLCVVQDLLSELQAEQNSQTPPLNSPS
jgi:hypothetical protein